MARSRANSVQAGSTHRMTTRSRANSEANPEENTSQWREPEPTIPELSDEESKSSDDELSEHSDSEFKDLGIAKEHEEKEKQRKLEEENKRKQQERDEHERQVQREIEDQRKREEREIEDQRRRKAKEREDQRQRTEANNREMRRQLESMEQVGSDQQVEKIHKVSDTNSRVGKTQSETTRKAISKTKSAVANAIGKNNLERLEKEKSQNLNQDARATRETPDVEMRDAEIRDVEMEDHVADERPHSRGLIGSSQEPIARNRVTRKRNLTATNNREPLVTTRNREPLVKVTGREPLVRREPACDNSCYENASIVGWMSSYGGKSYIVQYGDLDHATYRIKPASEVPLPFRCDAKNKIDKEDNRYGEKKTEDDKLEYGAESVQGIMGVAWKYKDTADPEEILNPATKKKKKMSKFPVTYVLVKWEIDGDFEEKWETRSALRRRWGGSFTDNCIFTAACEARDIHVEKYGNTSYPSSSLPKSKSPAPRQTSSTRSRRSSPLHNDGITIDGERLSIEEINVMLGFFAVNEDNVDKVAADKRMPKELRQRIVKMWNARKNYEGERGSEGESDVEID